MHNKHKHSNFGTIYLHFTKELGCTTFRKVRFWRINQTLVTLKICKQVKSNLEMKLGHVKKKISEKLGK
jgi:hypothetical protein